MCLYSEIIWMVNYIFFEFRICSYVFCSFILYWCFDKDFKWIFRDIFFFFVFEFNIDGVFIVFFWYEVNGVCFWCCFDNFGFQFCFIWVYYYGFKIVYFVVFEIKYEIMRLSRSGIECYKIFENF